MELAYFTKPEASKILQERGVVSMLPYEWDQENAYIVYAWQNLKQGRSGSYAYHFSDLLLPQSIAKIFPYHESGMGGAIDLTAKTIWAAKCAEFSHELLNRVQMNDWQDWLLTQLQQ